MSWPEILQKSIFQCSSFQRVEQRSLLVLLKRRQTSVTNIEIYYFDDVVTGHYQYQLNNGIAVISPFYGPTFLIPKFKFRV